jgi:hypothetical protein
MFKNILSALTPDLGGHNNNCEKGPKFWKTSKILRPF